MLELIAAVAEQATERDFQIRDELRGEIKLGINGLRAEILFKLDDKINGLRDELRTEMRELRNDNVTFHDEIIGYLKRAEQEREFMSLHLQRHDKQIAELGRHL